MPTRTFYNLETNESKTNWTYYFNKAESEAVPLVKFRKDSKSNLPRDLIKAESWANVNLKNKTNTTEYTKEKTKKNEDLSQTEYINQNNPNKSNFFENLKNIFNKTKPQNINSEINLSDKDLEAEVSLKNITDDSKNTFSTSLVYSAVEQATLNVEKKYKKFMIGILSLFMVLILINLYTVFSLNLTSRNSPVLNADTVSVSPNLQEFKTPESGLKIVKEFAGSSALADVGFQLDIQKNQIKTKGSPNCKTNILPPIENGCHFLLIPASLGIPSKGMLYKSISLETNLSADDKIQVDLKNYEKDKIENIGIITNENQSKPLLLPEIIPSSSGILFRLWAKNQDITIKSIGLRYFAVEDLKQVSGSLIGDLSEIANGAKLYLDTDSNGKFDKSSDKIWTCRPNFPGAVLTIKDQDKFSIEPDDSCFLDVKPDCWYKTKVDKCALPVGKWLLVLEDKNIVIPFEVKGDTNDLKLSI